MQKGLYKLSRFFRQEAKELRASDLTGIKKHHDLLRELKKNNYVGIKNMREAIPGVRAR